MLSMPFRDTVVRNQSNITEVNSAHGDPRFMSSMSVKRYKKNGHTAMANRIIGAKIARQFSAGAANRLIAAERRAEIANLLRERLSLRGICRAWDVSLTWLLHFMVECFASCPDHLHARLPARPAKVWVYKARG
jgi:hypothetical protein